ncbi:lipopolysaccharide biosynthesis protein [Hippea jasoniae]|uniref:lipopolysaccharide biosynthesis protein n=1 Tax=Hippea jasoniae TaxID=944479 RepID=UPI000554BD11|nr:oligosaccharide flippase family protein [Hippea jasoniae]
MKRLIVSNIFYSLIEKFVLIGFQFITSIIIIRNLPREDYGIIGVVAGYFVFLNLLNISMESIILRDHKNYEGKEKEILSNFLIFNIIKSMIFLFFAIVLSVLLINMFEKIEFIYSIFSITTLLIAESLVAPFVIYFTAKFNQQLVTKISIAKATLNLLLTIGLFMYPTLEYILIKDIFVSFFYVSVWFYLVYKYLDFSLYYLSLKEFDFQFIKKSFFGFSLWSHLIGSVTNFIYKSDTFFLSMFVGLTTIGNYNIALNSANIANIIPGILGYQNGVALSHVKNDIKKAKRITIQFLKLSFLIGIVTLLGFYLFGNYYIYLITGEYNEDIYFYMMCIVTGLVIVKTFASPFSAYLTIIFDIKEYFVNVILKISIFSTIIYLIGAMLEGTNGVAIGNIIIGIMFFMLTLKNFIIEVRNV